MEIQKFIFSPFAVNTYIIYDQTKECIIIDPACYTKDEEQKLLNFITENELKPQHLVNTHCHLDHVFGSKFISEKLNLLPEAHKDETSNNEMADIMAGNYGFDMERPPAIHTFIDENQTVKFGNSELLIKHVPGHTLGSLAFYNPADKWIIAGDVLFKDSIGRTDLPGGNFETIRKSIIEELYSLPEETIVYPGHGSSTSIGYEIRNNPFITF